MKNNNIRHNVADQMYDLLKELFPICRSITGNGVRESLKIIKKHIPINICEIPSGKKVFDWVIPKEWNIKDAYILDESGRKIVDFKQSNLHVLSYSIPVDREVDLSELQEHLYSLEDNPKAIPYVTSYYKERWGFCIAHEQRNRLKKGKYRVFIDSELKQGALTYGELIIPGATKQEIFLSTYICHPSMANNELSGPVVATFLAKWILTRPRRYTYRIVFVPEIIGSLAYLSKNLDIMKERIISGFNITCVGAGQKYSFMPSRKGDTLSDKVALNVLKYICPDFITYSFLDRGSDERQYCSPGVDLPIVSIMRSKYGTYSQYHTSLDDLDFVKSDILQGSFETLVECLKLLEENQVYKIKCLGEPQLGERGLYPTLSSQTKRNEVMDYLNILAYADETNDLIDISNIINIPAFQLCTAIEKLKDAELLEEVKQD